MQQTTPQFEQTLLKIGSIAFFAGIAISIISTVFHADGDPTNNIRVFAEYANSPPWIAVHIGQFVGGIVVFAGGFVALFRLLMKPESMIASVLVWIGFATAIIAASALSILQAVDGIALKSCPIAHEARIHDSFCARLDRLCYSNNSCQCPFYSSGC